VTTIWKETLAGLLIVCIAFDEISCLQPARHYLQLEDHPLGLSCTIHFLRSTVPSTWLWEPFILANNHFPKTIATIQSPDTYEHDPVISFFEQCKITVFFESTFNDSFEQSITENYRPRGFLHSMSLVIRNEGCDGCSQMPF